jgi:hypothetical protein
MMKKSCWPSVLILVLLLSGHASAETAIASRLEAILRGTDDIDVRVTLDASDFAEEQLGTASATLSVQCTYVFRNIDSSGADGQVDPTQEYRSPKIQSYLNTPTDELRTIRCGTPSWIRTNPLLLGMNVAVTVETSAASGGDGTTFVLGTNVYASPSVGGLVQVSKAEYDNVITDALKSYFDGHADSSALLVPANTRASYRQE